MIRHKSPISGIDVLNETYIATAGYDNQVVLWDKKTGLSIARSHHDHLVNNCRFSKSGRFLVTSSSDHTARLWAVPTLKLIAVYADHDDDVEMAALDNSETFVVTASRDSVVRIFKRDGVLLRELRGHEADVLTVEWLERENQILSSSDDGTVRIWNFDGSEDYVLRFDGAQTDTAIYCRNGWIIAGNDHGELVIANRTTQRIQKAHNAGIKRLAQVDANKFASTSYDTTLKIWELDSHGRCHEIHRCIVPDKVWMRACVIDSEGKFFMGTFGDRYATYEPSSDHWNIESVQPVNGINSIFKTSTETYAVTDSGELVVNGSVKTVFPALCNFVVMTSIGEIIGDHKGRLFNGDGELLYQHESPLNCACCFKNQTDEWVAIGTYTGECLFFRVNDGFILDNIVKMHENAVKSVAVNACTLAAICATGAVVFYDLHKCQIGAIQHNGHLKIGNGIIPFESGFASVGRDRFLRVWNEKGNQLMSVETPQPYSVKCIAASKSGRWLAAGSYGGFVALYDTTCQAWSGIQRPTTAGISCICFNESQGNFLAGSFDGNIYTINLPVPA